MPDKTMTEKIIQVCATCGSHRVQADAYAVWDWPSQEWVIADVFEKGGHCEDCDGECRVEARMEEPPEPDPGSDNPYCRHDWSEPSEEYDRVYCMLCNADGDA